MRSACATFMILVAMLFAWASVEPRLQASWEGEADDAKADLFAARVMSACALALAFAAGLLL